MHYKGGLFMGWADDRPLLGCRDLGLEQLVDHYEVEVAEDVVACEIDVGQIQLEVLKVWGLFDSVVLAYCSV